MTERRAAKLERDPVREWIEEALAPLPRLGIRRMFGGAGIYSGDTILGIVHDQRVYLKTDERSRPAFVERGCDALRVRNGSVLTSYYEVPAEVLDDEHELLVWAKDALRVAREKPAQPRRRHHVEPDAILGGHRPEIRRLAARARALIRKVAPHATEAGYAGWGLIGYRAPHYFCFVAPHPDHVRVGFEHGHVLPDPEGVLESMGKQVRFVRLEPRKRVPEAALRELVRAALAPPPRRERKPSKAKRVLRVG